MSEDRPVDLAELDLFDGLPCGIVVTDADGTVLKVNGTFCRWVGMEADELIGRSKLQDRFTMGGRIFHQTHWAPALRMQGSLAEVKFDVRRKDGTAIPMMLNAVRRQQGNQCFDIVSLTVAEERSKYERELLAARKRADGLLEIERSAQSMLEDRALFAEQMVGIVSHDLRNPLSAILMGARLLDRGEGLTPARRETLVRTIMSSARGAQTLIADLLDFTVARIGRGLSVTRKSVDLHALVGGMVDSLRLSFPGRTLLHVSVGTGSVTADGDRIAQLLGNLVANAMTYGDPGQPVTVTSEITPTVIRLAVHNEGEPIAADTLASMFEPMVRGSRREATNRSVGLGLFIVRAIATAHGGQVAVVSAAQAGTTFTFSFGRE